jgi:RES domain-containing protein
VRLWRIATRAHAAFDGEGARRYGSRWMPKGVAVVYASATLSLAALERFVHTDPDLEPPDLVAVFVDVDDDIPIHSVDIRQLPDDWRQYPAPEALGRLGESWIAARGTAILAVPSAVIPHEWNYVLDPEHRDFGRLVVGRPAPFSFDPRMWTKRRAR